MHITIDGFGGNPTLLGNEELVRNLLDRYPDEIGMTKITKPHVFEYHGDKPEDWGVSGFVIIAESHISFHTFPQHGQIWVDIFSCKGFDETPAIDLIVDAFELKTTRIHKLERGLEYPHSIEGSIPLNRMERQAVTPVLV